jgi:hypothetical protein
MWRIIRARTTFTLNSTENSDAAVTDGLAVQVEKRPSAVAERDGGVRLDVLGHVPALKPELASTSGWTETTTGGVSIRFVEDP